MRRKLIYLPILIITLTALATASVSHTFPGNTARFVNFATNNTINITVTAYGGNITNITFIWQAALAGESELLINQTNGTSAPGALFADRTAYPGVTSRNYNLTFWNASGGPVIENGTSQTFWFSVSSRRMPGGSFFALNINATNASGGSNYTQYTFQPSFTFTGYVLNETGCSTCWQNATNVTIYGVTYGMNSPPTSTWLGSTITNTSGFFRLSLINASSNYNGFKLKLLYYNASGRATKTGMIMPEFPSFMYYGGAFGDEGFDMTLNGATFYLQAAHTINISANNVSGRVSFGYEIVDQALGFPIESQSQVKTTDAEVVLPAGRGYTVSFFRMGLWPGNNIGYAYANECATSDLMNDSTCPAPPKTYSITATSATAGNLTAINQSLIVRRANVFGCLNLGSGTNNSNLNITSIKVKMLPWTTDAGSFIPPTNADDGRLNLTTALNYTHTQCPTFAFYNLSLLNQTGYMIEFYAKNGTNESIDPGNANNMAAFINFTANDELRLNGTFYKLTGAYKLSNVTGLTMNTSVMQINVINSSGGAVTTSMNANVKMRNTASGIGTVFYMIDSQSITNGTFYIPIMNNSNFAKVMIFSQNGPPKEVKINLSASVVNISIASMGQEKGFRKFHSNGSLEALNTTSTPITMRFLRNTAECAIPDAPSSCVITEMNASSFNPLKALLAGKVHMEIKITSTNVSLIFKDYDMMSAKQPPMESILEENASGRSTSGTAATDTWNFGSFAPAESYTNVTVIIPYSDSTSATTYLNESAQINVSIPAFFDENNRVIWNKTAGFDYINLTDDYIKYNNSYYRGLLNTTGMICLTTGFNETCFLNRTSNYINLHLPHFSTVGATVSGSATTSSSSSSSSGGGGGGGASSTTIITENQFTSGYTGDVNAGSKIRINITGTMHTVTFLGVRNKTSATITVASTPTTRVMNEGEEANFEVTNDTTPDLTVRVHNINSTAGTAKMTVKKYGTTTTNQQTNQNTNTTSTNNQPATQGSLGEERVISSSTWWTIAVIAAIVVLAILIALIITKYQQYKEKDKSRRVRLYGKIAK